MSDSGNGNTNSWTVIAPEETVAETVRPLAEEAEPHEDPLTAPSTTKPAGGAAESGPGTGSVVSKEGYSAESQQAPQEIEPEGNKVTTPHMEDTAPDPDHDLSMTPEPAHDLSMSPDPAHDLNVTSDPNLTSVSDYPFPLEVPSPSDTLSQSAGLSESPAPSNPDPDLFSDSYTHISPSVEEVPGSPSTPETLGAEELTPEGEGLIQEGQAIHQLSGEGHGLEEEESELSQRVTEVGKRADLPSDSEVGVERAEEKGVEGESGLRRRRTSLQAALERIGRSDEEEDEEDEEEVEEFRLPQRGEEESGFSLNKCILGAVILLGLGTIFFSGVFMDLDDEGEYDVSRELRDAETSGKQDILNWLKAESPSVEVNTADPLSQDKQQITVLQAQLQAQREELKVAQGQAAEGAKERLRREEVEKENAQEVDPAPDSATVLPPAVQEEQGGSQKTDKPVEEGRRPWGGEKMEKDWTGGKEKKKERSEQGERGKRWKDKGEKREWEGDGRKEQKAEKEWKKGKHDQDKDGKGWKQKEEKKEWKGKEEKKGEWKKEKASRGEEAKQWKEREERKEWKEKSDRKDGKKGKHDHWIKEKEWKDKSDMKERKERKEHEWKKGKDEWRGKKEWRKGNYGGKAWKDQGERKEWKNDKDFKKKDGKKEGGREWQEERKPWQVKDKESREGERRSWKEERKDGDWKKEKGGDRKSRDRHSQEKQYEYREREEEKEKDKNKKERVWPGPPGDKSPPQSHRQPPLEQPDYWDQQRARLQRNPSPHAQCTSVETCAQAEGILPVPLPEFEALLLGYLAKAEAVGVEASKREEIRKLALEFFKDGFFTHDQMSFKDFVEDVADILEDMVEKEGNDDDDDGDDNDEEEEPGIEDEMDEFEDEAMKLFALPAGGDKEQRKKGEWKESGRRRG